LTTGTTTAAVFVRVVNQHLRAVDDAVATSVTLPEKPLTLVTVTVVCLSDPTGIVMDAALSVMEKSAEPELTVTIRVADAYTVPPVPVTVTE